MSPRTRSFDWNEARTRWQNGETKTSLAREYGVTRQAIHHACNPDAYQKSLLAAAIRQATRTCVDCGEPCTGSGAGRCRTCANRHASNAVWDGEHLISVQCCTCKQWLDPADFPGGKSPGRGYRHTQCTTCQTAERRQRRLQGRP